MSGSYLSDEQLMRFASVAEAIRREGKHVIGIFILCSDEVEQAYQLDAIGQMNPEDMVDLLREITKEPPKPEESRLLYTEENKRRNN